MTATEMERTATEMEMTATEIEMTATEMNARWDDLYAQLQAIGAEFEARPGWHTDAERKERLAAEARITAEMRELEAAYIKKYVEAS